MKKEIRIFDFLCCLPFMIDILSYFQALMLNLCLCFFLFLELSDMLIELLTSKAASCMLSCKLMKDGFSTLSSKFLKSSLYYCIKGVFLYELQPRKSIGSLFICQAVKRE